MNKAIEKALFNKDVSSEASNPKLIYNGSDKQIKSCLINELKNSQSFKWAVSYVNWSGLSLLKDEMLSKKKGSQFLLTTDGYVTDPQSLEFLYDNGFDAKIYLPINNRVGFHLKTFLFANAKDVNLIIGSSNISQRGICDTNEMNAYISAHENGLLIKNYNDKFNELWNSDLSIRLTKEFIEDYKIKHKQYRAAKRQADMEFIETIKIEPNRMQLEGLEGLANLRSENEKKALVIAATGTGKTFLSALDVKAWKPKKMLFIVHSKTIKYQAERAYRTVFGNEKRICDLKADNLSNDVIENNDYFFATSHCARKLISTGLINDSYFDYVIIDECHKIGPDTELYNAILDFYKPKFLLGMTATPERTTAPEFLYKTFQNKIALEVRLVTALNEQLVCPFNYYAIDASDLIIDGATKDFESTSSEIIKQVKELKYYGDKLRSVVFVPRRKLADSYAEELTKQGYQACAITDEYIKNEDDVDGIIADLEDSEHPLKFIIAVDKFNEGVDIPKLNMVFFLRETSSKIIFLQQLGRGLRLDNDYDKYLTVIDFIQNYKREYKVVEALIGTNKIDRDTLRKNMVDDFKSVSPYMNVTFDKQSKDAIFRQISFGVTVKHIINTNFEESIKKDAFIPDLLELHKRNNSGYSVGLKELHQINQTLVEKFKAKYIAKYSVTNIKFHHEVLKWLLEFAFVGNTKETVTTMFEIILEDRVIAVDSSISKELLISDDRYYKSINRSAALTAIRKTLPDAEIFIETDGLIKFNAHIKQLIEQDSFLPVYREYYELFENMKTEEFETSPIPFNNYKRSELLKINESDDLVMNTIGEYWRKDTNKLFAMVNIFEKLEQQNYENLIIDRKHFKCCFKSETKLSTLKTKVNKVVSGELELILGVRINKKANDDRFYNFGKPINLKDSIVEYNYDGKKHACSIIVELEREIPEHIYNFNKLGLSN